MTTARRQKTLIVIQLTSGNDYLNTVVPYGEGRYYDSRSTVNIPQEQVIPIDNQVGFNPSMGPVKTLWDEGKVAIIKGIGYENPNRSHFRSMDIWHTAEPGAIGREGWLGRTIRDLDPQGDNVLTGINFGRGLPRALGCPGVSVTSVGDLETYGLFPDIQDEDLAHVHPGGLLQDVRWSRWTRSGDGQFNFPWGVAVDREGNVYVADWRNDRIQKFTNDCEFLAAYGGGEGRFQRPARVAADSEGFIYVADWGNERVQVLGPDGSFHLLLRGQATVSKWAEDYFASNPEEKAERDISNHLPDLPAHLNTPYHVSSQTEPYFWGPVSVTLDREGRLDVAETNRHRFQVYQKR